MRKDFPAIDVPSPGSRQGSYRTVVKAVRSTINKAADLRPLASLGFGTGREGRRYRAFISYSHRDAAIARWLHRSIENFPIPRELVGTRTGQGVVPSRLRPLFRDEDELPGAAELGPELEGALCDSAALLVICSPAAAGSIWVDREIRFFKQQNPDCPVFAVIAEGVPGGDHECFPESLRLIADAQGDLVRDDGFEPLAPDLQKQDRQIVKLKLIAGLLGVKYNDLYRRERRRARRLAALSGTAALIVIAALTALSIVAISSAHIARVERNAARRAQARAEHNAEVAERRAWLAQTAAIEIRRQDELLNNDKVRRPQP